LRGLPKHGLAVTIDDIAREDNINRRTVFRYFASRDDLLAVALTQQSDAFRASLPQLGEQGWQAWLADLCQAVHQANDNLHRTLDELVTRPRRRGARRTVGRRLGTPEPAFHHCGQPGRPGESLRRRVPGARRDPRCTRSLHSTVHPGARSTAPLNSGTHGGDR
jgi:AcrR family transcriptional regulator